jgi:hypothetical protein
MRRRARRHRRRFRRVSLGIGFSANTMPQGDNNRARARTPFFLRVRRMRPRRALLLAHRWAGVVLAAVFVMWFASGIVLAYAKYPRLTRPERLAGAPALDFSTARLSPARAAATLRADDFSTRGAPAGNIALPAPARPGAPAPVRAVRLAQIQGRPAYVFSAGMAQPVVVFADDGSRAAPATPAQAEAAAQAFALAAAVAKSARTKPAVAKPARASAALAPASASAPASAPPSASAASATAPAPAAPAKTVGRARFVETVQSDQWTVAFEMNEHRPLLRVAMDDAAGTEYYVSGVTGEVVRDTRRAERALNWLGAVPHWIYPHSLRKHPATWEWVVCAVSVAGVLVALSGLAIGARRLARRLRLRVRLWRRRRFAGTSIGAAIPVNAAANAIPAATAVNAGTGATTTNAAVSAVTPPAASRPARRRPARWHWLAGLVFGAPALAWVFSGWMSMGPRPFAPDDFPSPEQMLLFPGCFLTPSRFHSVPELPENTVEASLLHYDKQPLVLASSRDGLDSLLPAIPGTEPALPSAGAILARVHELMPGAPLAGAAVLTGYDNHYYTRHPGEAAQPLPAVRARFADPARTWFHIDAKTGRLLGMTTARGRVFRHLHRGLHSLDWWWLWSRRPLWDIAIVGGALGGLALSLTGLRLGLRRLRHALRLETPSTPASPAPPTPTPAIP